MRFDISPIKNCFLKNMFFLFGNRLLTQFSLLITLGSKTGAKHWKHSSPYSYTLTTGCITISLLSLDQFIFYYCINQNLVALKRRAPVPCMDHSTTDRKVAFNCHSVTQVCTTKYKSLYATQLTQLTSLISQILDLFLLLLYKSWRELDSEL